MKNNRNINEGKIYCILVLTMIGFSGIFVHTKMTQSYTERAYHKVQVTLDRLEVTDQLEKMNKNEWYRLYITIEYLRINGFYGRSFATYDPHYTDWSGIEYLYTWAIPANELWEKSDNIVFEWSYCCEFGGTYGDAYGSQIYMEFKLQRMRYTNWVMETGYLSGYYGNSEVYGTNFSTGTLDYACFGGELEIDFVVNRL